MEFIATYHPRVSRQQKGENYGQLVADLKHNFQGIGVEMPLKIQVMHLHLGFFPENLGNVSDEHGERFQPELYEQNYKE